jgi:sec-independent protein translocase protein TatA
LVATHFQIPLLLFNHFKFSIMSLGWNEILLILLVVLLLFGGRKIPELMRGMGKGIREFQDAKNNVRKEIEEGIAENPRSTNTSANGTSVNTTTTTQP